MSRDIKLLHPKLRNVIPLIVAQCETRGLNICITDGFRSQAEQDRLFAQGRTTNGNIVTNARYPNSAHNWGVAFDFCRNVVGMEYNDDDNFFKRVADIAKPYGLAWGGDWKNYVDKPHLQLSEFMPNNSVTWLKTVYGNPDNFIKSWDKNSPAVWYKDACEWCITNGIIQGDGTGKYNWTDAISKEQLAQILYNFYNRLIR